MQQHTLLYRDDFASMGKHLASLLDLRHALIDHHTFPDGESYIRLSNIPPGNIWILDSLYPPNDRIIELILSAHKLRAEGVSSIRLVSPYLPYMRQDTAFHEGEVVNARAIGKLISAHVDEVITVDPHLHRIHDLNEVFYCETTVLHANDQIAAWIGLNLESPVIVGPDSESQQWVSLLAEQLEAPYVVFKKERKGDRRVSIEYAGINQISTGTPVILDDIISTGVTMANAGKLVFEHTGKHPVGVAVHGIFSGNATEILHKAGFSKIITTNSLPRKGNQIDLVPLLADTLAEKING
ncbi:MAG: ribose-phosphate diphosphokinase [Cyclobacteriaceae bacterium]